MAVRRIRWEDIRVLSAEEIEVYPAPEVVEKVISFTYVYKDYPPRTLFIPKAKYIKPEVLKMIEEDIAELEKGPILPP